LSLVGAPVIGSKVLSATPDGVNHLTSMRRAKLSVYDMIRLYYDELSADILAKWTPKAVMTELAESVPDV